MEDNTLYDFDVSKAFPVFGPNRNITVFETIPPELASKN
jgi:hypothetical protein